MTNQPPQRTFYITGHIRATDLKERDVARIDGHWRFVYGLYQTPEDVPDGYGLPQDVLDEFDAAAENTVLAHLLDDEASSAGEVVHIAKVYVEYDLVEIQIPA